MKFLVLNGPNINMLGLREPAIYGRKTYQDLLSMVEEHAKEIGVEVLFYQSNHEGSLVDRIQQAYEENIDGIIFNPAAYTHTSIALLDALKAVGIPTVEVHISKVEEREDFRQISYVRKACIKTITGHGLKGYVEALDELVKQLSK
ncbi:MAG: type II 3-dehydroquinate dehydratase [Bacilli bacterium]|nr:type II 3-dehydroquinate dehydratase [Bacilli bacterium]